MAGPPVAVAVAVAIAAATLLEAIAGLPSATDRDDLMGIEGAAARVSFAAWGGLLAEPWAFAGRNRRPPTDPPNVLLSILATLLHDSCEAAVVAAGLDPGCGFLHAKRYGRASLATDLMEEFRPIVSEAVALTILNKRLLDPSDSRPGPGGRGLILNNRGWTVVAAQYERRLRTLVRPDGMTRRISYRKVLEMQARRLRATIEGTTDRYRPFLVK